MVFVVVGGQFGDEGKGKIVDVLANQSDYVVRYQGGANAGHTLVVDGQKRVFHLLPSGALHPNLSNVIGNGLVVDVSTLLYEIDSLERSGFSLEGRFFISNQAHILFPWHRILDALRYKDAIGTTVRGIGPAYTDKIRRVGVRFCDFGTLAFTEKFLVQWRYVADALRVLSDDEIRSILSSISDSHGNSFLRFFSSTHVLDKEKIFQESFSSLQRLLPYVVDTAALLHQALADDKKILLEGAQGTFLDIDHGTYPYVTSCATTAGNAAVGSGIGPTNIKEVCGVFKAFQTRVGAGPFPSELLGAQGDAVREKGKEYAATTGRPRRCGWFDTVVARRSVQLNGMTQIALTKLDVLDSMPEIKICVGYTLHGKPVGFLQQSGLLGQVEPVYETMPGWNESTVDCRRFEDLPQAAQAYVRRLEELIGCRISMVSVGPGREAIIQRSVPHSGQYVSASSNV